jgi:hypothetical protein
MFKLRFRLVALIVVPFISMTLLLMMIYLDQVSRHLEAAQYDFQQTLLSTKISDASRYLSASDYVALAAILDDLTLAAGSGRAEVQDSEGTIILGSGDVSLVQNVIRMRLSHEGKILGSLVFELDGTETAARIQALLFGTLVTITLVMIALVLLALSFGDFILIWLSLDLPAQKRQDQSHSQSADLTSNSDFVAMIAMKVHPPRLAPVQQLRTIAAAQGGILKELAPGEFELNFAKGSPDVLAIEYCKRVEPLISDIAGLNVRWAIGMGEAQASVTLGKRTRFLASLSQGSLVLEAPTLALIEQALVATSMTPRPMVSALASDLALFTLDIDKDVRGDVSTI